MEPLTTKLKQAGFINHLETSGAYPLSGQWDWICFSPKKFKKPLEGFHTNAQELKVIVYNKYDFDWAEEHASKVSESCVLYLQPEWSVANKMQPLIIEYVKSNPKWRISLQTHKYLNIQ
jgi:7-carboxy-7-deazaguanine synthase